MDGLVSACVSTPGLHVHAADHKAPAGLVRVTTVVCDGRLDGVNIAGDFTLLPQDALAVLEARLDGLNQIARGQPGGVDACVRVPSVRTKR
jgi:hypothetical protein